jgi:uncharacterized membrane protein HdeD (DUF308 family)
MAVVEQSRVPDLGAALTKSIHDHWRFFVVEGVIFVVLGLAAVVVPLVAGLATAIFLGWLFAIGGIVSLVSTFATRHAPGFWWSLLSAVVTLAAGGVLLWSPGAGVIVLTYVLIAYFIVEGVMAISLAFAHRRALSGKWEWLVLNGIIDLILAVIIIASLPSAFTWALGLLVGIDLVFGGGALVAMGLAARKMIGQASADPRADKVAAARTPM